MKLRNALALGMGGAALALLFVEPSLAQSPTPEVVSAPAAAAPVPNKGDTAWVMISAVLVLLMTVPGLALFYGGLVRTKNMLSILTQVFAIAAVVSLLWVAFGYSMAFTNGGGLNDFVGGFSKVFLKGVDPSTTVATFSNGVVIPEYVYICFQMTFAMITPGLIVGAFAERMKFSALLVFSILWVTLIYFPMAHMVWYWGGPDVVGDAAKALAAATDDASKATAQAALDAVNADAGMLFKWGALDFAGGTVVHINAGIAGFVGCLMLGKRIGYGRDLLAPHSLTMTTIGASLLWVGWFGFNVGSNLEANGSAGLAMINTFVATAAAAVSWLFVEWMLKGKPSLLGMLSGAIAGLVAVTPAAGFAGPMGSIVLGFVAGGACFIMCSTVKNALGYDDSLDVFGVHCIGGILGALATGILVSPDLGGVGIPDYTSKPGELVVGAYDMAAQLLAQGKAVGFTILWSAIGSAILYKLVDLTIGLRVTQDEEREGLDIADHGERAYNY
ncbi:ammonium transporter [Methylobacterium sp. SD274]|uniref:ammonium transporter n=1 Tax=unclassified Methylobacterium TaxID=2615210 RepID=UPI0006F4698A|nr:MULTISPECIES: ammonium transporter [unclassified Methylobacterium]KQO54282.1 ammonia channel protein [Methylobacterium sp. Leaf86]KQO90257.1 ammonia channel protein [Methylobacterium sp. Leaf91]MBO1021272.1 ammonium transporter [Methylobacterium sp. SD274]